MSRDPRSTHEIEEAISTRPSRLPREWGVLDASSTRGRSRLQHGIPGCSHVGQPPHGLGQEKLRRLSYRHVTVPDRDSGASWSQFAARLLALDMLRVWICPGSATKSIFRPEKRKYIDVQQNLKNGELEENPCPLCQPPPVDCRARGYTADQAAARELSLTYRYIGYN